MPRGRRGVLDSDEESMRAEPSRNRRKERAPTIESDTDSSEDPDVPGPSRRVIKKTTKPKSQPAKRRSTPPPSEDMEQDTEQDNRVTDRRKEEIPKELCQYILMTCKNKGFAKEEELRRIMGPRLKAEDRDRYMNRVKEMLKDAIGVVIVIDVEQKRYYLQNLVLPKTSIDDLPSTDEEGDESEEIPDSIKEMVKEKRLKEQIFDGIAYFVLGFIFCSRQDGVDTKGIPEEKLQDIMKFLDEFDENDVPSKTLLQKEDHMSKLVQQGWIKMTKITDIMGNVQIFYDWGPRALKSIDPYLCLKTFCGIMNQPIEDWEEKLKLVEDIRRENGILYREENGIQLARDQRAR